MKKSEVSKIFLSEALNAFKNDGFVKKQGHLRKQGEHFEYDIDYAITDYIYKFPTGFNFGISSKLINNIIFLALPERDYKKNKFIRAFGVKQARLNVNNEYPVHEHIIESPDDIVQMVKEMYKYFKERGFAFLEQLSSYEALSKHLNSEKVYSRSMLLPDTLTKGIIFSRITKDKDYSYNKSKYRDLIKTYLDTDIEKYSKVVDFLDKHTPEELLRMLNL